MKPAAGIAATGHVETSRAAVTILRAGGNAFDAALAALCAACVAEPLLVSLGGGGFMLAREASGRSRLFDFFCQTPSRRRAEQDLDFFPITADFGNDTQQFHVGQGAIAVPGVVAGLFEVHRQLGHLPLVELVQPAVELARRGCRVNSMHHYVAHILDSILRADPALFQLFSSPQNPGHLIGEGELLSNPALADAFECLVREGEDIFYRGDWARQLVQDSQSRGGSLAADDLADYRVACRRPLHFRYQGADCQINPPPSPGGSLIAYALAQLRQVSPRHAAWGSAQHAAALVQAMRAANAARHLPWQQIPGQETMGQMLDAESLTQWQQGMQLHSRFSRGTTHISVADAAGNLASLTASNGEGNVYVLPGTGIILNNMLGEQDLNPAGFHRWQPACRLASMMSPLVARLDDGSLLAMGSGGSNRIRSAITQVMVNLLNYRMNMSDAVEASRCHLEGKKLSVEAGFDGAAFDNLSPLVDEVHGWPEHNLFFGGVHAVQVHADGGFTGAGDSRRDGAVGIA